MTVGGLSPGVIGAAQKCAVSSTTSSALTERPSTKTSSACVAPDGRKAYARTPDCGVAKAVRSTARRGVARSGGSVLGTSQPKSVLPTIGHKPKSGSSRSVHGRPSWRMPASTGCAAYPADWAVVFGTDSEVWVACVAGPEALSSANSTAPSTSPSLSRPRPAVKSNDRERTEHLFAWYVCSVYD